MKRFARIAISSTLAISLAFWGISPALADEETNQGDDTNSTSALIDSENNENDSTTNSQDSTLSSSSYKPIDPTLTLDTIDDVIEKEYTSRIEALCSEGENLLNEITTYDDYLNDYFNGDNKVKTFYKKVVDETNILCVTLCDYAILYVELAMNSDLSDKERKTAAENLNKLIYEDAYKAIDDNIYNGLLDDFNDKFLDDILKEMPEDAWADEFSQMKADEAMWLQSAYDDVYYVNHKTHKAIEYLLKDTKAYLSFRVSARMINVLAEFKETLDNLKFHSGVITESTTKEPATKEERAKVKAYLDKWDDEAAKAHEANPYTEESYEVFTEASKTARIVCNAKSSSIEDIEAAQKAYDDAWYGLTPIENTPQEATPSVSENEPSSSFKEAMDSYEAFFDEYIAFMQTVASGNYSMGDYLSFMSRYATTMEAISNIDESSLSTADQLYYLEVMGRINNKLASVALA